MSKLIKSAKKSSDTIFSPKPYKIGIALSGGGIKGMCHAGVLKALEEAGIKPDIISGVSAGAIVGALYADGYSPDEIAQIFDYVGFRKMTRLQVPDGGFFRTERFEKYLGSKLRAKTFDDLKIPLRIVATNLDRGKSVTFSKGKLLPVVMASSNIPILFSPRRIDGESYVDGGVFMNFPVSVIRQDCENVIGVNASPLAVTEYKNSILNIAMRTYHFMFEANTLADKAMCDFLIEPVDMVNYDTFETEKSREIFELGYKTTRKMIKERLKETEMTEI